MALPHFEVITFPGQIFWLFIAAGITYGFNKLIFLPSLSSAITKRQKMLHQYQDETEKMQIHIENLQADILTLSQRAQVEVRIIMEQTTAKSQAMLFEHSQNNHIVLTQSMKEYDEYIKQSKLMLAENIGGIIQDLKDKILHLILRKNI